jgi:manganese transport protein
MVVTLIVVIFGCFAAQIVAAAPPVALLLKNLVVPSPEIVINPAMLYVAIGIIGATVMPHNLYLHSAIVQTRAFPESEEGKRDAIKWATTDSTVALMLALFVNAAILIISAVAFHDSGHRDVADIGEAFRLLSPLLGLGVASILFAVALLASGINSTVTATLAGQIVMEGFLRLRLPPWMRRLLTRGIAIIPVVAVTAFYGERGTGKLLVLSQVILSMQLPFAVIPLVQFVSDRRKMGSLVISRPLAVLAWIIAAVIVVLNVKLLGDTLVG